MNVFFTTVVRAAPQERGGELVHIDWDDKRLLSRAPVQPDEPVVHDPNPRGSTRGGRGILVSDSEVFAASYHTIHLFDHGLSATGRISNQLFAGLHEVCWDGDGGIWASATCIDLAVRINRRGETLECWSPRSDPILKARFGLPDLQIDLSRDNRCCNVGGSTSAPGHVHLNAIAMQDGRPLMLLNRYGCLVRLHPTEILIEDQTLSGCHNVIVLSDGRLAINDTRGRAVRIYSADGTPEAIIDLTEMPPVRDVLRRHRHREIGIWLAANGRPSRFFSKLFYSWTIARPVFVRGLCETGAGTILVGISPAMILEIDPNSQELIDSFEYSRDLNCCIHGLACYVPVSAKLREDQVITAPCGVSH